MKFKKVLTLLTALLSTTALFGCSNDQAVESTAPSVSVTQKTDTTESTPAVTMKKGAKITIGTSVVPKTYTHSNKVFIFSVSSTMLSMENGWEILSGGTATNQQTEKSFLKMQKNSI